MAGANVIIAKPCDLSRKTPLNFQTEFSNCTVSKRE